MFIPLIIHWRDHCAFYPPEILVAQGDICRREVLRQVQAGGRSRQWCHDG